MTITWEDPSKYETELNAIAERYLLRFLAGGLQPSSMLVPWRITVHVERDGIPSISEALSGRLDTLRRP
jgi:hypothetical protein